MSRALDDRFRDWKERAANADISQEAIRRGCKLKRSSGAWQLTGPCLACGGRDRFAINPRKRAFICRGGGAGDVIAMVMHLEGVSFLQAIESITGEPCPSGAAKPLSEAEKAERNRRRLANEEAQRRRQEQEAAYQEDTKEAAQRIWDAAVRIDGTLAETYLRNRGLSLPLDCPWPRTLRFAASLPYPNGPRMPAMICRVDGIDGELCAIWRVYLSTDGKKASVPNAKLGLGPAGGGAVRLAGIGPKVAVAEGIETAFAFWLLTGRKYPVLAALSTSGMVGIELPLQVENVVIAPDGDAPMRKQDGEYVPAVPAGRKAAQALRTRLLAEGVACTIAAEPPAGKDYADLWVELSREVA